MAQWPPGRSSTYAALAREDYYREGGEPLGRYWGGGAERLGLTGTVSKEALTQLFAGFAPDGTPLVQNAGMDGRRPGVDCTFSLAKKASVLWSQSDLRTRKEIEASHAAGVQASLSWYEQNKASCRVGKAGQEREPAQLIVALYDHGTNRNQEPHLHTHALIVNAVVRADGETAAHDQVKPFQNKMVMGALYRVEVSYQLEMRLGLELERHKNWFDIKGVPDQLSEHFSSRRQEILEHLAARGQYSAPAAAIAALATREVKSHIPREQLLVNWQEIGREFGFGPDEARRLLDFSRAGA